MSEIISYEASICFCDAQAHKVSRNLPGRQTNYQYAKQHWVVVVKQYKVYLILENFGENLDLDGRRIERRTLDLDVNLNFIPTLLFNQNLTSV